MGSSQTWEWQNFGTRIAIRDSEYDDSFIALILAENSDKQSKPNRIHNKFRAHGNTKTVAHRNTKTLMMTSTLHKIWSCQLQVALFMSCFCWSSFSFSWHRSKKMEETFHESKQPNAGTSYEIGTPITIIWKSNVGLPVSPFFIYTKGLSPSKRKQHFPKWWQRLPDHRLCWWVSFRN